MVAGVAAYVYGLYPTFNASQVVDKINEWAPDGVLTGIREYPGEPINPSGMLRPTRLAAGTPNKVAHIGS